MSEVEITLFNASGSSEGINAINLDRGDANSIFKLLVELGAAKDIRFNWDNETGRIHIMKRIYVPGNEDMPAVRMYSLYDYIKLLIRFDKSAHKRMNNVKNKINDMHQAINKLEKQL